MKNQCRLSAKNHYHIELCDAETGEIKQVVDCHNLVLNIYTNKLKAGGNDTVNAIYIGTGTSAPAATDTGLKNLIHKMEVGVVSTTPQPNANHVVTLNYPTAKRVMKAVVAASNGIGALTEIGVGYYYQYYGEYYNPMTRALFVDSEGNPIVINKTATDILNITVTINYSFVLTPHPEEGVNVFLDNSAANVSYQFLINGGTSYAYTARVLAHLPREYKRIPHASGFDKSCVVVGSIANGVATCALDYLYSDEPNWNGGLGYDVRALLLMGIGVFKITPAIFPPTPFPKYQVGVGDGSSKDFNIKTQSCKEGTQKVYIDGVLKTEGVDYTFNPANTKDFFTNYISSDSTYITTPNLVVSAYSGSPYGLPGYPTMASLDGQMAGGQISAASPMVYDFGVPVTVNCMYMGTILYSGLKDTTRLEYSTDGVTWNVYQQLSTLASGSFNQLPEVTARYWRYETTQTYLVPFASWGDVAGTNTMKPFVLFGYYKPSIQFVTAPANGAVIEIEYDIKYPFHNDKHSIRFSYTHEWLC